MPEKKEIFELTDDELNEVAGGYYDTPEQVQFIYNKGKDVEVCDYIGIMKNYTHSTTITSRGYAYSYSYGVGNGYTACYYLSGDSDVAGWYPEYIIDVLEQSVYLNERLKPSDVTVVD